MQDFVQYKKAKIIFVSKYMYAQYCILMLVESGITFLLIKKQNCCGKMRLYHKKNAVIIRFMYCSPSS